MIFGAIPDAGRYVRVEPLGRILTILQEYAAEDFQGENRVIDGDRLFLIHAEYETERVGQGVMEAHRRYADVMLMLEGEEAIFVKPVSELTQVTKEYDPACDALFAKADPDAARIVLRPGDFAVFFPEDAHCPACAVEEPRHVKKVIAKVLLEKEQEKDGGISV